MDVARISVDSFHNLDSLLGLNGFRGVLVALLATTNGAGVAWRRSASPNVTFLAFPKGNCFGLVSDKWQRRNVPTDPSAVLWNVLCRTQVQVTEAAPGTRGKPGNLGRIQSSLSDISLDEPAAGAS